MRLIFARHNIFTETTVNTISKNRLISISFFCGLTIFILACIFTYLTRYHEFTIYPFVIFCNFLPGLLFGTIISRPFSFSGSTMRVTFIVMSTLICILAEITTFLLVETTNGYIIILTSSLSSLFLFKFYIWIFDVKQIGKNGVIMALISGFLSAVVMLGVNWLVKFGLSNQNENTLYYFKLISPYFIFPCWMTGFSFTIYLQK